MNKDLLEDLKKADSTGFIKIGEFVSIRKEGPVGHIRLQSLMPPDHGAILVNKMDLRLLGEALTFLGTEETKPQKLKVAKAHVIDPDS